jgi:hypothetical protein
MSIANAPQPNMNGGKALLGSSEPQKTSIFLFAITSKILLTGKKNRRSIGIDTLRAENIVSLSYHVNMM